ncbi:MAG: hypothetical protein FJ035_07985 [Chloroflexi bacterium]|nr:hypothetical protein [Chloroflexota bacterium]
MERLPELAPPATELHLRMYRDMLVARELNERMFALNRQERAAFVVFGAGREAAQVGSAHALQRGVD